METVSSFHSGPVGEPGEGGGSFTRDFEIQ
jgi:hypothetical protein